MSLNAQAIAVSGYGYGAQLIAVSGYGVIGNAPSAPPPVSTYGNRIPARKGARIRRQRHEDEDILLILQ